MEAAGWRILDRNWRDGPRELDLVAVRDDVLAFVEVKARSGSGWGHPLEGITRRKRREVERAARAWIREHADAVRGRRLRFDAVAVWFRVGRPERMEHVVDAWRVGQ